MKPSAQRAQPGNMRWIVSEFPFNATSQLGLETCAVFEWSKTFGLVNGSDFGSQSKSEQPNHLKLNFVCVFCEYPWKNVWCIWLFLLCQMSGFMFNNKSYTSHIKSLISSACPQAIRESGTLPLRRSRQRKQFQRKADNKKINMQETEQKIGLRTILKRGCILLMTE